MITWSHLSLGLSQANVKVVFYPKVPWHVDAKLDFKNQFSILKTNRVGLLTSDFSTSESCAAYHFRQTVHTVQYETINSPASSGAWIVGPLKRNLSCTKSSSFVWDGKKTSCTNVPYRSAVALVVVLTFWLFPPLFPMEKSIKIDYIQLYVL